MKHLKLTIFAFIALTLILSACNKNQQNPTPKSFSQNDQSGSSEIDASVNDVNDFINNKVGNGSSRQRVAAYNLPCGVVSVDSTLISPGVYKYTFNYGSQTACGYKYKSGKISFSLTNGTAFNQAGAKFNITFTNYKVEVKATGSVVTLNGTITVTNVNGGYIWEPVTNSSTVVTHSIRGTINITYANGNTRPRNHFQKRTWANSSSGWAGLNLTIDGDSTSGSMIISETGQTYDKAYPYVTQILTPFKWSNTGSTYAGPYVLKQGNARMNLTVPLISPTYIDVEAGYYWSLSNLSSTPTLVKDNTSNAYKISVVIGPNNSTTYQLY